MIDETAGGSEAEGSARGAGLIKIGAGGGLSVVAILVIQWLAHANLGHVPVPYLLALPFVLVAMGLLELVSGVRFTRLASRWDQLSTFKQVVLSGLVLALAVPAIFGMFMLVDWR